MNKYTYRVLKRRLGWLLKNNQVTRRLIQKHIEKRNALSYPALLEYIETADKIKIRKCDLRLGIVKDEDNLSFDLVPYWPKYERFARNNELTYSLLDFHRENWIEQAKNYDLIVWRPSSDPSVLYEQVSKTKYIEKVLNLRCYPSSDELWYYEDKLRVYYLLSSHNLPVIPAFITFSENEAFNKLDNLDYPVISKSNVGSSSFSIKKIKNRVVAKRYVRKAFSSGVDSGFPYMRQRGYIYFQKFIPDAAYDLRIIIVGKKIFGYYRMKPTNDFRASGAGLIKEGGELPLDVVKLALKVKEVMPGIMLAVDFLKPKNASSHLIIETSICISVSSPAQLRLGGIPGYYTLEDDKLVFHPGKYWLQELILEELINNMTGDQ